MIGYSDSGKDAGRLAAAWGLYTVQARARPRRGLSRVSALSRASALLRASAERAREADSARPSLPVLW